MQANTTFGRRGAQGQSTLRSQATAPQSYQKPVAIAVPTRQISFTTAPWVTIGIVALLILLYGLEGVVSAAGGHSDRISHRALVKLGGLSGDLALGQHQYWRLLTVSLLHLNIGHLAGNAVALILVGLLLEPLVGRGWFFSIYVVGGIGGAVGSILMNPPQLLSVGASGAIMCLLSCTLVLSFHTASSEKRRRMQFLSLRVMIPALLPLSTVNGHIDYSGHIGGAATGLVLGFLLQIIWPEDQRRPPQSVLAGWTGGGVMVIAGVALVLAALSPKPTFAETPGLIPIDDLPRSPTEWTAQLSNLGSKYPADPRLHLFEGLGLIKANNVAGAEAEFLAGLQSPLLGSPEMKPSVGVALRAGLVVMYVRENRFDDARTIVAPLCSADPSVAKKLMTSLHSTKLCDPV